VWSLQGVLHVLRNSVHIGKIAHGEELYEGKHEAIVDAGVFAQAQLILSERAEVAVARPNSSDYLLSGKLRCRSCEGAYVGAGAHGRSGFYRYYVCRTRQAKGPGACRAEQVPADDLENAVSAALVTIYSDYDFIKQAAADAYAAVANELPRLATELAATEAQLRETTAAIDRYLKAFEAGTMAENVCGPRVAELFEQRSELVRRQQELARQVKASAPSLPTADDLVAVANQLRQAIAQGSPEVVKQFLGELIDRIEIGSDKQAQPYFWVPRLQAPDRAKEVTAGHRFVFSQTMWSRGDSNSRPT